MKWLKFGPNSNKLTRNSWNLSTSKACCDQIIYLLGIFKIIYYLWYYIFLSMHTFNSTNTDTISRFKIQSTPALSIWLPFWLLFWFAFAFAFWTLLKWTFPCLTQKQIRSRLKRERALFVVRLQFSIWFWSSFYLKGGQIFTGAHISYRLGIWEFVTLQKTSKITLNMSYWVTWIKFRSWKSFEVPVLSITLRMILMEQLGRQTWKWKKWKRLLLQVRLELTTSD